MNNQHSVEKVGFHEKLQMPIWQCAKCGRKIVGERVAGHCKPRPPRPESALACVYRKQKLPERVPCGKCPKTNRATMVSIYVCTVGGKGRACALVDVGRADVTPCVGCRDRKAPDPPVDKID